MGFPPLYSNLSAILVCTTDPLGLMPRIDGKTRGYQHLKLSLVPWIAFRKCLSLMDWFVQSLSFKLRIILLVDADLVDKAMPIPL